MKNIFLLYITFFILIDCNENNSPIDIPQPTGAILDPWVGGTTEPNQVWIDLDMQKMTVTPRIAWDFGFYSGKEFRVILNTSISMAAGKLETTDINAVTEAHVASMKPLVAVATFQPSNIQYVDDIKGNYLERTAIDEISANDKDNKVYLINMGNYMYTGNSTDLKISGDSRGWKKIRILRNGTNGYRIQYANISDTTFKEYIVNKDTAYNFNFLSLDNGPVSIQPTKNNWDLCFTVFVNEIKGSGTYVYSDFVITNTMDHVGAYQVLTSEINYEAFTKVNVDPSKFIYDDQRVIGANWRTTFGGAKTYTDRFYILKDHLGTLYKIRFLKLTNSENLRGYPQFEYDVLN